MTPLFKFALNKAQWSFISGHTLVPAELRKICMEATMAQEPDFHLIVNECVVEKIFFFCMDFVVLHGFDDDYNITPEGRLAEEIGDIFSVESCHLWFHELDKLKSTIEIPQTLCEKLEELPSINTPKFVLGIGAASLLRDLCLASITSVAAQEDQLWLQIFIDRFYISNRVK